MDLSGKRLQALIAYLAVESARAHGREELATLLWGQMGDDEGELEEAMELHRRRLALDPTCEPAHRSLMELLARTGRRSDALRQYQQCADAPERELGARTSPDTKAAFERIRHSETEVAAQPTPAKPSRESHGHPSRRPWRCSRSKTSRAEKKTTSSTALPRTSPPHFPASAPFWSHPDFDPKSFIDRAPYEHAREKNELLDALRRAGL